MNGNVTKDGIAKDLQWMKRIGIGGMQNFDAALQTPQIVERPLVYMSPEWQDAFRYSAQLADELGLELAIAASPGWSETGGPWVEPKDGMKKLVWSETQLTGGRRFRGKLASPPSITGPFQTLPAQLSIFDSLTGSDPNEKPKPIFYSDVAVLAYPVMDEAVTPAPKVRTGDGKRLDAEQLFAASFARPVQVARGTATSPGEIYFSYDAPRTLRSATLCIPGAATLFSEPDLLPRLEAKEGSTWRSVVDLPLEAAPTTVSFAPVSAREFRLVLAPNVSDTSEMSFIEAAPGAVTIDMSLPASETVAIAQLKLSAEARVDRYESKSGFAIARDYYLLENRSTAPAVAIAPGKVIDLTARMQPDGTLDWMPPRGKWRVLRMGYSLTGTTNHPATPEATGLEVDKFDGDAVRNYLETYIAKYRDVLGPHGPGERGLKALLTDSIEVGTSNWTPKMIEQFERLRGYDPRPWLPALTGVIVGSRAQSDAFLFDFRRTLADLLASEHYGQLAAVAHRHGLIVYGEALESLRPLLGDDIAMRAHADIPMAALWAFNRDSAPSPTLLGDLKGAASVAHLYGRQFVAAESLTSGNAPWAHAPSDLKHVIDLEFACGINRPVIHTSVHQPVDDKMPGLSLLVFGQYFNRHETWAEMAKPWIDYIARSSYLLQQGRNVADVAYFHGEEAPLTALHAEAPLSDTPKTYAYDFINASALLDLLSVSNGELVSKSGARYKALYLGGSSDRMTLPVLRRLAEFAAAGATIVGHAPTSSPSLKDDPREFAELIQRLWRSDGQGRVIASRNIDAALRSTGVAPAFDYVDNDGEVLFVQRSVEDREIYFLSNRANAEKRIEARFRVVGKTPQIWRADTGATEPVSYRTEGNVTVVPLEMLPQEAFFVVFGKAAGSSSVDIPKPVTTVVTEISGSWDVAFQSGRGAPTGIRLPSLSSLAEHADPGIKYFSGIATYTKNFTLPEPPQPEAQLLLDLGRVGDVAEVRVNGTVAGIVWKSPYRLDISALTRSGRNTLEVRVANLWVNRLIGDAHPDANKVAFTTVPTYRADAPLRPSGLMGPVRLLEQAPSRVDSHSSVAAHAH